MHYFSSTRPVRTQEKRTNVSVMNKTGKVRYRRSSCRRATRKPEADRWAYMSQAPVEFPHWVGWWCPECFHGLDKLMGAQGVEPDAGRLL